MGECVIPMRSGTEAEKGRRLAVSRRILVEKVAVDPALTKHGCTVGLRVPCREVYELVSLLDYNRIPHGEVIGRAR